MAPSRTVAHTRDAVVVISRIRAIGCSNHYHNDISISAAELAVRSPGRDDCRQWELEAPFRLVTSLAQVSDEEVLTRRCGTGGVEQEVWNRRCGTGGVEQEVWNRRCGTGGVEQEVWNRRCGTGGVEQGCGTGTAESDPR
jgi:hypothetical protein